MRTPAAPALETKSPFEGRASKSPTESPYVAARREWNERYGDYIAAAKAWRLAAFVALGVAAVAVGAIAWVGAQNRVVPYIVEVNNLGESIVVARADHMQRADNRVLKAQLARFVVAWRTVTADLSVARRNVNELYAMLSATDPATIVLNDYMRQNSPFERAANETVNVEITNLLPISGETWQIEWIETRRTRHGETIDVTRWRCSPTIAFQQPKDDADIMRNPIGLFIKEIAWSKQLQLK
jgi:type IV secretion system protein VirB5